MSTNDERMEHDSLGSVPVPATALFGAHTVRACANFTVSDTSLHDLPDFLRALAEVKMAAARANVELGEIPATIADAIVASAREIVDGRWHDQFPIRVVQGGGGTATNMNMNEVLANRAAQLLGGPCGIYDRVHPNDHVNRSQSTNDVYPTALCIAVIRAGNSAVQDLAHLQQVLEDKSRDYHGLDRLGRTCLQDALPLAIDASHSAQAHAICRTAAAFQASLEPLYQVPLGATAIGTGLGAPPGFRRRAVELLSAQTGLALVPVDDPYDALTHLDPFAAVSAALVRVALVMAQLASDLRLLSSGPHGGIGEVRLPAVQVGSSIMPGKVNPVIPELVLQVSFEIRAAHAAIEMATAAGELELNVMGPVVTKHLLHSIAAAGAVARIFADRCLAGLTWNTDALADHLRGSYADAVERAQREGYEVAARHRA